MSSIVLAVLLGAAIVNASPSFDTRQSITALTTSQIDAFTTYTYYASAGHCTNTQTLAWNCGTNCKANPDFKPVASGGNGDSVQYWFVGYDPKLDTVIVSHQGTNTSEILPLITDLDILKAGLGSTLFPGISSNIEVHNGFRDAQASTATDVLAAVKSAMSTHRATSVTMVGHSLGAAITLLDSVYLPLWLPKGTTFRTIGYGLPRVGNQYFANYIDANVHLTHINNKEDPIPIVPGKFLGFVHPAGECIVGDVPEIWDGDESEHDGPYNGVEMGC
ncbi:hypothetical protein AZE42_06541 [Rhizopogon vesiculosus]|uniref:Fungal lipase-type domain-containing protein n=1 Tax=Rhizopogon vesiculosus TaxID=180088 RepID=A0A1J8PHJ3_9AGAM|nr:hypothetical protein AZE42_06541 [Rhizopogon vesiculosus]